MVSISGIELVQSVALNVLAALNLASHHIRDAGVLNDGAYFDYVIIGGGTAGCVLANRLSENPNVTVALLEAGPQQPIESVLPALYPTLPETSYDYNFLTEQDSYTAQYLEKKVPIITSGKMLGGTSGLDPLYHIRSNPLDFKRWVEATGDNSWGYDEMLKYYIKSERLEDKEILNSTVAKYHGTKGPIGVSRQSSPANENIIKAFEQMGLKYLLDINADQFVGVSEPILHISGGTRQSTSEAYLIPAMNRKNLFVYTLTTATKVLFDNNNKAIAVEAINFDNQTVTINARKEIIISSGTMKTVQLLALSGIGLRDNLDSWGIDVVSELPVGQAVRDQVGTVVAYKLKPSNKSVEITDPKKFPVPVTVAFKALDSSATYPDYQAINLLFPKNSSILIPVCSNEFKYIDAVCDRFIAANKEADLLFSIIYHLNPISTGKVVIRNTEPLETPWIYMGTFKQPEDLNNLGRYVYDFSQIANTEEMKAAEAEFVDMDLEFCNDLDRDTYDFWRCYARDMSTLLGHASSSAPTGSVLSSDLKVNGVKGLRVVGAASMPVLNSGQLTPDVIALAEKAADLIKADQ